MKGFITLSLLKVSSFESSIEQVKMSSQYTCTGKFNSSPKQ